MQAIIPCVSLEAYDSTFLNRYVAHMSVVVASQLPSPFSRSTYMHSALQVGLHVRHVGATHVSKETATSICGAATAYRPPADFFPPRPESNASVIAAQRSLFFPLRNALV